MKKPKKQKPKMELPNITMEEPAKDNSPRVPQRDKLPYTLALRGLEWTQKQKDFIEVATHKDTRMVFLSGPAGTSKTALAVFCALTLMNAKKASELIYVRSIVESASHTLGSLPGEAHDKFKPFAMPLVDKLEEFLCSGDIKKLFIDERVKPIPVNYLRGASYNANCVIVDEAQNLNNKELVTAITRVGKFSKFFILKASSTLSTQAPTFFLISDPQKRNNIQEPPSTFLMYASLDLSKRDVISCARVGRFLENFEFGFLCQ